MRSSSSKVIADVARHELIGLSVTVESRDAGLDGLEGQVVDETMHTLLVEDGTSVKRVPKHGARFVFEVEGARVVVEGDDIRFRPEDRTKKARR